MSTFFNRSKMAALPIGPYHRKSKMATNIAANLGKVAISPALEDVGQYPPYSAQGVHIECGVDYTQSNVLYSTPHTKHPILKVVYIIHFTYRMKV